MTNTTISRTRLSVLLLGIPRALLACLGLCTYMPEKAHAQESVWNERVVAGPSALYTHAMAFDTARGVVVLFGGLKDTPHINALSGETWEWNGTTWNQHFVSGPSPRSSHAMAYDSARGVTVLFGGSTATGYSDETWEWNGTVWTQRFAPSPLPTTLHAMAYDSARNVTVLFGGRNGGLPNSETWEWNGTTWTKRSTGGPLRRESHAMAYDAVRHVTVLFGGYYGDVYGDTWEWNGSDWAQRVVPGPSPRYGLSMVYDVARSVTVLFGGYRSGVNGVSDETWEWNGTAWNRRPGGGPGPRWTHAMAYDSIRGLAVMFGGSPNTVPTLSNETWEFGCIGLSAQPAMQFTCPGGDAPFTTTAVGQGPLTYQWRHGSPRAAIPGATDANYAIIAASGADEGIYDCIVTNACGSTISGPVSFSLCPADFNCDGALDFFDYDAFVVCFEGGRCPPGKTADFDGDGATDFFDYDAFVIAFEVGC